MLKICILLPIFCLAAMPEDLRLGIIGTDTSHAIEFKRILNDASGQGHVPGARVVAAYKGGSPDLPVSSTRIDKFAAKLQTKYGIESVPDTLPLSGCGRVVGYSSTIRSCPDSPSYDHDPWLGDKGHIYKMATYQDVSAERILGRHATALACAWYLVSAAIGRSSGLYLRK